MRSSHFKSLLPTLTLFLSAPALAAQETDRAVDLPEEEFALPTFVLAEHGEKAVLANGQGVKLGHITDYVIAPANGALRVIAVDAKADDDIPARSVPFERFEWDVEAGRLVLAMTPDELAALPPYEAIQRKPATDDVNPATDKRVIDASVAQSASRSVAAGDLLEAEVQVQGSAVARVGQLVLEPQRGVIAFVLAQGNEAGVDPYLVPWQAMKWQEPEEIEVRGSFLLKVPKDRLSKAPRLKASDLARLQKPTFMKSVYAFYEIVPPFAVDGPRDS